MAVTTAPRLFVQLRDTSARPAISAPVPAPAGPAVGPRPLDGPVMPMQMPNAIAAGRGVPVQAPASDAGAVAYAQSQYQEHGDPFTAAAEGLINASDYRDQQAQDQAKRDEAAKLLDAYPDIQAAVAKGVMDIGTGVSMAQKRDELQQAAQRKTQIIDYLTTSGDVDVAQQFENGVIDESGVQAAIAAKDKGTGLTEDQKTLQQINDERAKSKQDPMSMEDYLDAKKNGFGNDAAADLPQVGLGADGLPDPAAQNEFLAGLDSDQDRTLVKNIANYQLDLNSVSIRGGERARIVALVKQYDPSYSTSQYPAAAKMRMSLTTGDYSKTLQSANLVIQHLANLKDAFDKLGNQGGLLTPWNQVANAAKGATGDPNVKAFQTARDGVATELSKVFRGTGAMSIQEITEWQKNFDANTSPPGMQASIETAMKMLEARLDTVKSAYNNALGRPQDFTFLTSSTVNSLKDLGIDPTVVDGLVQDGNAADLTQGFKNLDGSKGARAQVDGAPPADAVPDDTAAPDASTAAPAASDAAPAAPPVSMTPRPITSAEAAAAAHPTTQAEFDALPKGTLYINPADNQPKWKL